MPLVAAATILDHRLSDLGQNVLVHCFGVQVKSTEVVLSTSIIRRFAGLFIPNYRNKITHCRRIVG